MKIFLDDFRTPLNCVSYMHQRIGRLNPIYLEEWKIAKNYNQFVKLITESVKSGAEITHISFDHDLSDTHYGLHDKTDCLSWQEYYIKEDREMTGYDCAKWLKGFYIEKELHLPVIFVHSMNPIGTENILNLFKVG
jgi:hypothetical protein